MHCFCCEFSVLGVAKEEIAIVFEDLGAPGFRGRVALRAWALKD
jgi:hypothetical protein